LKATIYKSTGSWYIAKDENKHFWNCRIKGRFKIDKTISSTNPLAVGDVVNIEIENEIENSAIIDKIEKRKNYVVRTSPHNKNQRHIISSNLDQSIIIVTLKQPRTSSGFLDRFLITCEAYRVPVVIIFNKIDLLNEEELEILNHWTKKYTSIGHQVYAISLETNKGVEVLHSILENKISLLSGQSGVGKSTFINKLFPGKNIKTLELSDSSGKGMHTTTFAEMHDVNEQTQIIDTPGIRELGLIDIERHELAGYFPEMKKLLPLCKYNNCVHINEPNCAVKLALDNNEISVERYANYLSMLETISEIRY
jgi:ribosome biogenesis GTPase